MQYLGTLPTVRVCITPFPTQVDAAVIGIPGRFAKQQREAVGLAARAAGLKKIKILSEPELALRAYLLVSSSESETIDLDTHSSPHIGAISSCA